MAKILIGTCSWTDPTLLATDFYPRGVNTAERRLQYYARLFSIVEVDSTYYSMPAEKTARLWVERTPSDFTFNIKAFSLFTHHPTKVEALPKDVRAILNTVKDLPKERANVYYRDVSDEARSLLWQRFSEALLPLDSAGKLGAVLFQFPEWFFPGRDSREYLLQCRQNLAQYRLAVEFRNGDWLSESRRGDTFKFLRENGFIYVCVDEPQGFRSSVPPVVEATSDIGMVRFHGRNKDNWEKKGISVAERFKYFYSHDELAEWLLKLAELASRVKELHLMFNNCYHDFGVRNARDMDILIRPQSLLFPDHIKTQNKE